MAFVSIHVPNFILQAVLRIEPNLRSRAVALLDGTLPLCTVVAVNDSALRTGIEIGMTEPQVAQFCEVEKRHRSLPSEKSLHAALLEMGWSISPRIEDTALDTIILDVAGLRHVFGSNTNLAHELARRASELGLTVNVSIAANIDAAFHSSRGFPGITLIPPGEESEYLGLLPVSVLSPSVEILETLARWGISTCAELAALPVLQLSERLGQEGVRLHEFARGATVRSLAPAELEMSFKEEIELDDAVEELEPLAFLLGRLLDQLCARLQAHALAVSAVHLRFDLGDAFEQVPAANGKASVAEIPSKVYETTMRLPVPVRDSKLLLNLLRLHLQTNPPRASIVKITLAAEPAHRRAAQNGLFRRSSVDAEKLELTVARLKNLVGEQNVGSPEVMDTHRPGAFRMNRFLAAPNETQIRHRTSHAIAAADCKAGVEFKTQETILALRNFRPEWLAKIEICEDRPVRISFRGMRGKIVAASGPWRNSGDWWREDAWRHEEWDIYVRFHPGAMIMGRDLHWEMQDGLYRIYYECARRNWFVRGRYD